MDEDFVLNITSSMPTRRKQNVPKQTSVRESVTTTSSSTPGPREARKTITGITPSGLKKITKKSETERPEASYRDVPMSQKHDGLNFHDPKPDYSKNSLQVGLSAKQHPSQQELLNLIGETVHPNIESVFAETSWSAFGEKMNLHPHLISVIQKQFHFEHPTSIQVSAIGSLCDGRDVLIKAQTGSGKTLSYALPLMHRLMAIEPPITRNDGPKALVLLPTRELVTQTAQVITQLCRACVRIVPGCFIGGAKRKNEKATIRKGLNVIVSTPQRLLDHLGKTAVLSLRGLQWLVIDEADRLVELGFERDVRHIIDRIRREIGQNGSEYLVQTVLLSATLSPGVENLAGLALRDPVKCEVSANKHAGGGQQSTSSDELVATFSMPSGLKHFLLVVPCKLRLVALAAFLLLKAKYSKRSGKLMVFFATQACVDFHYRLFTETLCNDDGDLGIPDVKPSNLKLFRLHGNMDYNERQPVFQAFTKCPNGILLTTDVASRGLDLAGIAWVIQYHVSGTPIDYVHRVGRTARAGGKGKALLILQPEEETFAQMLAATVGVQLEPIQLSDVLQTALFHQQHCSKKRRTVGTIEEAAASLSSYFIRSVTDDPILLALAESAYLSFLRAYASLSREMRTHFTFKLLHLGHVARAFCLQGAPSDIAARMTGKRGQPTTDNPPPQKKSRRLEFEDIDHEGNPTARQKNAGSHKPKPSELATRNMMAEYGL